MKLNRGLLIKSFILISTFLYILFIFFSTMVPVIELKYLGILLCFGFSFLILDKELDTKVVRLALFFTVISDLFLLVLVGYELIGVMFFCFVQLLYGFRLLEYSRIKITNASIIRFLIIILFQIVGLIIFKTDLLSIVSCFYFANLVTNVIFSFYDYKANKLFAIGLLLFMFCDLFVGLNNSDTYFNIPSESIISNLLNPPIDLMWFFYYPSQVLITLSILTNVKNSDKS